MTREQLIDMFTMRVDGNTLQAIASKYGTSRQAVQQYLQEYISGHKVKAERYPNRSAVAKYMEDNRMNASKFADFIGMPLTNLTPFLLAKTSSVKTINRIIKATGLTYEEIMKEELE